MSVADVLWKFAGGVGGGVGEMVGKVAGKAADWIPSPAQYRRKKIRELTNQMLDLQRSPKFDAAKYERLCAERSRLENDALDQ